MRRVLIDKILSIWTIWLPEIVFDFIEAHKVEVIVHLVILTIGVLLLLRKQASKDIDRINKRAEALSKLDEPLPKSVMESKPAPVLNPPKDDPISVEELAQYNGSDPSKPIYVAIKGAYFQIAGCGFD